MANESKQGGPPLSRRAFARLGLGAAAITLATETAGAQTLADLARRSEIHELRSRRVYVKRGSNFTATDLTLGVLPLDVDARGALRLRLQRYFSNLPHPVNLVEVLSPTTQTSGTNFVGASPTFELQVPANQSVSAVLADLRAGGFVQVKNPMANAQQAQAGAAPVNVDLRPNKQWQWDLVGARSVWPAYRGANVVVTTIDLSFDVHHPAFPSGTISLAESGYIRDLSDATALAGTRTQIATQWNEWPAPNGRGYSAWENHGTACAGLVGGRRWEQGKSAARFTGAAPESLLRVVAISEEDRSLHRLVEAVRFARDAVPQSILNPQLIPAGTTQLAPRSPDIIVGTLNFGGIGPRDFDGYFKDLDDALKIAMQKGILIFWSAPNAANDLENDFIASHDAVIPVVACDSRGRKVFGSRWHTSDQVLVAPGFRVPTTKFDDEGDGGFDDAVSAGSVKYGWFSGCSAAAAVAGGCAALLVEALKKKNLRGPELAAQARSILFRTAAQNGGLLNIDAAIKEAEKLP